MTVKVRSGSRWVDATPKRWDGSRWVTPSELKRWDGSRWVTIWEASSVPGTPSAPELAASNNQIVVSWTAPSTGGSPITHYDLRYRAGSGSWTQIDGLSGTSRTLSSLTNGTSYDVQVRAANAKGDGAWSTSASATPGAVPGKPAAPTLVASNAQIVVSWTAPSSAGGAITSYSVRYRRGTGSATRIDGISGTSHTLDSLDNGQSYEVRVRAVNAKGHGPWSDPATAIPGGVPSKPSAPSVDSRNAAVAVSWTAPASSGGALTHYDLRYRRVGTSSWTQIDGISGTSRTISSLSNGRSYEFQVRAANSIGDGAWSSSSSATPATVPSAPTAPTLETGNAQLSVSWSPPDANGAAITHYDLQYRRSGSWTLIENISGTSRNITGLSNGQSYEVRVRAANSAGDGAWSSSSSATPGATPNAPSAPTLTSANGQISASWSAPGNNGAAITHYDMRYRQGGSGSWTSVEETSTSRTITGLTNGESYQFQVRAANSRGDGPYSATATATAGTVPSKPSAPSLIGSDSQIAAAWSAPTSNGGAITHYDLGYRQGSSGVWTLIENISGRSRNITGLTNSQSYQVRVRAANTIGDGPWSDPASATPQSRSYSVTGTHTTHVVGGHVHIVWTSNGSITFTGSYNVQFICIAGGGGGQGSWQHRFGDTTYPYQEGGGGAGGGGGILLSPSQSISNKAVTITVGSGGANSRGQINGIPGRGSKGKDSKAAIASGSTFTATGGGGGGGDPGGSGGSGGGGGATGDGGSGTSGQGNSGGDASDWTVWIGSGGNRSRGSAAGGGGGAGGAGGDGSVGTGRDWTGGTAGAGKQLNLTGSNVRYSPGGRGGGTGNQSTVNVAGAGGPGGAQEHNDRAGARNGRAGQKGLVCARFKDNGGSISTLS